MSAVAPWAVLKRVDDAGVDVEDAPMIYFTVNPFVVGRNPTSDLSLSNPCISGVHCVFTLVSPSSDGKRTNEHGQRLIAQAAKVTITDLSTNGCWINGCKLGRQYAQGLKHGDFVRLVVATKPEHQRHNLAFRFLLTEAATPPSVEPATAAATSKDTRVAPELNGHGNKVTEPPTAPPPPAPPTTKQQAAAPPPSSVTLAAAGFVAVVNRSAARFDDGITPSTQQVPLPRITSPKNGNVPGKQVAVMVAGNGNSRSTGLSATSPGTDVRSTAPNSASPTPTHGFHVRGGEGVTVAGGQPLVSEGGSGESQQNGVMPLPGDVGTTQPPRPSPQNDSEFSHRASHEHHHNAADVHRALDFASSMDERDLVAAVLVKPTMAGTTSAATSGVSFDDATDAQRRQLRFECDVTEAFDVDFNKCLGSGSFASVYVGVAKADPTLRAAVKIVLKSRLFGLQGSQHHSPPTAGGATRQPPQAAKVAAGVRILPPGGKEDDLAKAAKDIERQKREAEILCAVSHPNIVACYGVYETSERIAYVMELCEGGELFNFLKNNTAKHKKLAAPPGAVAANGETAGHPPPPRTVIDEAIVSPFIVAEPLVRHIARQITGALMYLHGRGIAHRDIKLENLLLLKKPRPLHESLVTESQASPEGCSPGGGGAAAADETQDDVPQRPLAPPPPRRPSPPPVGAKRMRADNDHAQRDTDGLTPEEAYKRDLIVKLGDFGLSRMMQASEEGEFPVMSTMCGTPVYVAPEVINTHLRQNSKGYTPAVDMFSVGVVVFALLVGKPPFPFAVDDMGRKLKRVDYKVGIQWPKELRERAVRSGSGLCDFVERLLAVNPVDRLTAEDAFHHPFLAAP